MTDRQERETQVAGEEGGKQEVDEPSEDGSSKKTQPKIINRKKKTRPQRRESGWGGHLTQVCNRMKSQDT